MRSRSPHQRQRPRKSRGRGLRTTSGCRTCRRRHLKCDEAKPICGACARKDTICEYPNSARGVGVAGRAITEDVPVLITQQTTQQTTSPEEHSAHVSNSASTAPALYEQHEATESAWTIPEADTNALAHPQPDPLLESHLASSQSPISLHHNYLLPANASIAAVRWFGLLANDAARESSQLPTTPQLWANQTLSLDHSGEPSSLQCATQVLDSPPASDTSHNPQHIGASGGSTLAEGQIWQSQEPIEPLPIEATLFEHFIHQIDLLDPTSQFSTLVAHLAIHNAGLMNAILALAFRHLALNPRLDKENVPGKEEAALQYYYQTLHYVQKAMQYSGYKTSLELLATTLIISAYEMLDNSTNDWERHLEGVFLIQRSQTIHGESGGLHSAVWWAWLCQDIWAAFREKRKTLTFWVPQKPLSTLLPHELAMRSIYITAKVVSYCAEAATEENMLRRIDAAVRLRRMLEDWRRHLTIEFSPLPLSSRSASSCFQPVWIRPPAFAVAVQFFNVSQILLFAHEPSVGGLEQHLERQGMIKRCVEDICGIAMILKDDPSSLMSSQALFIAGLFIQEHNAREAVLELLDSCRERTGWPVRSLGGELQQFWGKGQQPTKPPAAARVSVPSISS
ncbi:hypothetical protein FE257_008868 [Aspergillus nanangensis]|uniref:Zn(2)-C6 fungal-type domain-containing protein n=1 Tax=Aspergillus nanangensis TaxID=2582783 RepID=A0AAD4GT57_ASPNN|nr:hypothetical protein FE257_008868 [Aspergillus nanangensis]